MHVMMIDNDGREREGEIENTLEALQAYVDGYIEVVPLTKKICVICNDEGKLKDLPVTAWLTARGGITALDALCGPLIICRTTDDGEFADIQPGDTDEVRLYVHSMK